MGRLATDRIAEQRDGAFAVKRYFVGFLGNAVLCGHRSHYANNNETAAEVLHKVVQSARLAIGDIIVLELIGLFKLPGQESQYSIVRSIYRVVNSEMIGSQMGLLERVFDVSIPLPTDSGFGYISAQCKAPDTVHSLRLKNENQRCRASRDRQLPLRLVQGKVNRDDSTRRYHGSFGTRFLPL